MNTAAALAEFETAEYQAVDALHRMAAHDPRRARLQAALSEARLAKARFLARSPSVLRKSGGGRLGLSLPVPSDAAATFAVEEHCRIAEERRLGKRAGGTRRYKAPEELRGKPLHLIDGRSLDIPEDGVVEVADGRHPAAPGASESPAHGQLLSLGFEALPDKAETDMDVVKASLARPIVGDRAFIEFLNRNARAGQ
jgi:hypothetical protein